MNLTEEIKNIILKFIENKYELYLKQNNLLLIKEDDIHSIINSIYDDNIKNIKSEIRIKLKETYKNEYPSASVENIILDIFLDKELNINKIIDEISVIQKKNYTTLDIPIINNSLNLNIQLSNNYIVINSANSKNINIYDNIYATINKYKFIYSINDKIFDIYKTDAEKINAIKEEILNKSTVTIGLYYLKADIKTENDSHHISSQSPSPYGVS